MSPKPLNLQRVMITGAANGLGEAIARHLHDRGARLVLLDRDADGLARLADRLGPNVQTVPADLADASATIKAVRASSVEADPVDTLIHNAAVLVPTPFGAMTFELWNQTVNVGLQAAFLLTRAVWPGMQKAGGAIVLVSSRSGIEGFHDETAYCAAKHGLEGFMKCLALEGAPFGIQVNTVTPGMFMRTPMSERNYTEDLKTKWVDPMELAPTFAALAERRNHEHCGQRLNAWEMSRALKEQG
ncbi:SDR family oxidoreductase [Microvirga sp. BT689]|uniref:SDR family NAD(P)-dependent oxidoreductase n=1 Tax=Microvirga arvi TaxID=2778731 RepID=UPI001950F398|nr:SDR family oxidoreductase [Microvirga arvi]MBM6581898.1 SDR family oxidoreductase [Microvirga arvi]